jgi:hypothetical protein
MYNNIIMSINYKEKYLKYTEKYLELKNQLGRQPEMSIVPDFSNEGLLRLVVECL